VSRDKGLRAPDWVANYLHPWFPDAVKTPNSRSGRDLENTPGMAIEVKTGAEWRPYKWMAQAAGYGSALELAVLVYLPPGMGEAKVADALTIVPLRRLMPLAVADGYAPKPIEQRGREAPGGERTIDG
jgi:hypothetical protein